MTSLISSVSREWNVTPHVEHRMYRSTSPAPSGLIVRFTRTLALPQCGQRTRGVTTSRHGFTPLHSGTRGMMLP
ncbi:MAG: hypothetical protein WBD40_01020 [Tepidisphaeraceae bacterium]